MGCCKGCRGGTKGAGGGGETTLNQLCRFQYTCTLNCIIAELFKTLIDSNIAVSIFVTKQKN